MKIRIHLIILLFCLPALSLQAQDHSSRQIYNQAESDFEIGRVEQALSLLQDNIDSFKGNLQLSAYRLLAICHLSLDENEKAEQCTRELLNYDPYYTASSQDPQRFIDMVESIKQGLTAKITTASSQAESLSEVPVPTTLITEEMIHNSGANNLQEVLAAYVPGMNIVDCNDDINISMRGIYSNGQEKILIMLNGHRLNSYCTNIASPDFSIGLEKIKQIEVLRGPASSLYGGVALTAVVNIITKQGADVDGVMMRGGIGNYGQLKGDMLFGKRYFDLDILVWGSLYKADGETMPFPEERRNEDAYGVPVDEITIGHIGNKPSYDFGLQLKWKDLNFMYNTQFSQITAPYTMGTLAKSYDHDRYKTYNGYSPSFATLSHHADLSYSKTFGKLFLKGTLTYDNSDLTHYQVIFDNPLPELGYLLGLEDEKNIFRTQGIYRYINGQEMNYGLQLKGDFNYINSKTHNGSVAFGTEFSHFRLDDVRYFLGYNFTEALDENPIIQSVGKGHENSYNAFLQLKHKWHSVIFNAGLRYDHKKRTDDYKVNEFSPRVALILLQPKWNLKFSYSKSFVDAPYLYRKTTELLPLLIGSQYTISGHENERLLPESVNSVQLTFSGIEWIKGLTFELNGFYNRAKNMIMTHIIQQFNEGNNKTAGAELMVNYKRPRFTADLTLTYTKTLETNLLTQSIDDNNNLPYFTSHAVFAWKALPNWKLFTHIEFEGKQTSYNLNVVQLIVYEQILNKLQQAIDAKDDNSTAAYLKELDRLEKTLVISTDMDSRVIFHVGTEYKLGNVTFGLKVNNLFNTNYNRGGMNTKIIPQKGRWFMFNVAYKF